MTYTTALIASFASVASAQFIEFEYFIATYECDAVDEFDFEYPCAWAYDSHNEAIDVCERVWNNEDGFDLCCTPSDRLEFANGCSGVDSSLESGVDMPDACDATDDEVCGEITNDEVTNYYVQFDACDYSYNCAEPEMYDISFEDTTPPVIGSTCESNNWNDDVEKCTYFDMPGVDCFDHCDLELDVCTTIMYGCQVTEDATTDNSGKMVGVASQQFGEGGEAVDEVDVERTGTYCIEYNAVDLSGNYAWRETFVVVVEDTIPCEIDFEETYNMHECCDDTDIIDYGESSNNLPCSDLPEITNAYAFDGCHVTDGAQTVSYWANDGEGNDCEGYTTYEIEDTTAPTCTAPANQQHCVCQDDGAYECLVDGEEVADACMASFSDTCDDGVSITDDSGESVDECTIGTYTVTFTVEDAAGNTATCENTHEFDDCTPPECTPNTCSSDVEACTGEYTEMGATFTDTYDADIQSKSTTTYRNPSGEEADSVDAWVLGTWTVEYAAQDQNGHQNTYCGIEVVIEDNTPPTVSYFGDDVEVLEASMDYSNAWITEPEQLGGSCDDTCNVVDGVATSTSVAFEYEYGIGLSDITDAVTSVTDGYVDAAGDENYWITDEQQYYCGGGDTQSTTNGGDLADAACGVADTTNDLYALAADCAFYEVTHSCEDWVGNTASVTQYIATIDTTPPTIYTADCYDDPEQEECGIYFRAAALAVNSAVPAAGVALVALVAGVAFKTGRRSTYMPL